MNPNTQNQDNGTNNQNGNAGNMNGPATPAITGADIPLALKARYFGSGLVVGVFVAPMVRGLLGKFQPKLDGLMDGLTGQAEGLVEKGSDLVAKAREALRGLDGKASEAHAGHDHEHDHAPAAKPRVVKPQPTT